LEEPAAPIFSVEGYLENGCIRFLQNVDTYLPYHIMSHKKTAVFKIFYGYINPKITSPCSLRTNIKKTTS
jgi:hypothetical protein